MYTYGMFYVFCSGSQMSNAFNMAIQAPVIQSIHCPVEAVNMSQAAR